MKKKKKISGSFAMQATILVAASIISKLIGMAYNIPFANILSDEGNGYYGAAQTVYALILLIATFSIPAAVSKIMAERIEKGEYRNVKRILNVAMLYVFVIGGIAAVFAYIGAPYLVTENSVLSLRVLAPTIFLSGFLSVFRGYYQAYGNMVPTSISQVVEQIFNAIFSIGAALFFMHLALGKGYEKGSVQYNVYGAAGGTVGTGVAVVAGLLYMIHLYLKERKDFQKKIEADNTENLLSYGAVLKMFLLIVTPIIFSSFIYNVNVTLDMNIYQKIMKTMGDDVIDGYYGIYSRMYLVLANVPIAMAAAVASAIIPRVSGAYATGDRKTCNHSITESMQLAMVFTVPCAVGFAVLGKPISMLLYRRLSESGTQMLTIMLLLGAFSIMVYGISSVLNGVLQGIGKVNVPVISSAVALVLHILLLLPCLYVFHLGIYSLILATTFYAIIVVLMNYHFIKKELDFKIEWKKTVLVPLASAFFMGIAAIVVYKGLDGLFNRITGAYISNAVAILTSILVAAGVYFIAMIKIGGYTEEMLLAFPKGTLIVKMAKKLHLI